MKRNNDNDDNNMNNHYIKLIHLPLRPSTIQLVRQRGFETIQEIIDSKECGGYSNLAAELGIMNVMDAHHIYQEIIQYSGTTTTTINNMVDDDSILKMVARRVSDHTQNHHESTSNHNNRNNDNANINETNKNSINNSSNNSAMSAMEILTQHEEKRNSSASSYPGTHILTFCREIDELLGNGIALGIVTEIAGGPGTGKTQLCMQLAVNVALPACYGGVQGQTIYIDTEGSFSPERCYSMATALIHHVDAIIQKNNRKQTNNNNSSCNDIPKWNMTPEEILNNIHVFRVHDDIELISVLTGSVPEMIRKQQSNNNDELPIRLIVIDSIAFPFRSASSLESKGYYIKRTKQLAKLVSDLGALASKYQIAIVAINQMTTKRIDLNKTTTTNTLTTPNYDSNTNILIPALGESFAHSVTIRLILNQSQDSTMMNNNGSTTRNSLDNNSSIGVVDTVVQQRRTCTLIKSPSLPCSSVEYQILECGIRSLSYRPLSMNRLRHPLQQPPQQYHNDDHHIQHQTQSNHSSHPKSLMQDTRINMIMSSDDSENYQNREHNMTKRHRTAH